jgi:DNA-binding SARP family transcriptional activator
LLAPLTLKLLGVPALTVGPQQLPALPPIDVALLAVLALQGEQPRQQVAALLWPDAGNAGAATNLRQRIYRLKRQAGRGVVVGDRSIALPDDLQHDLQGYAERLVADPRHGRGALLGTLEFPAHETLSAWLGTQRESLAQTRVRVLSRAAQMHAAQGRIASALDFAQAWLHHAPVDEQAHRLHIQLLYQQGNRAGALAAYRQCEQLLRAELGVEPSTTTQALLPQLQEAASPRQAVLPSIPIALLRPPRLVARDEPWRRMAQAAAARRALVLEGEAGMGKSRLLGDFVAGSDGWCLVSASPGDSALPLALLARLLSACMARWGRPDEDWVCAELARLTPEAGTPSTDAFATLRLQQAVRAALVHWHARGMAGLALDDLHHADSSSLSLLLPLAGITEAAGLPWLLATRPPAAAYGLDALPRLDLQPLSLPGVQELVASLGLAGVRHDGWAPVLLQRTGGNPLFLLQTLTAAFEAGTLGDGAPLAMTPLPASLSALLAGRMERLSAQARAIARLACVAGPDFTLELACQLLDAQPAALADPWLELQAAQVMHDGRFAHDLIRDAAAAITPPAVRSLIHAQVAQALAQAGAPAGRVAEHWDAAGRWPEAAQAYQEAADQARAHGAVDDELLKLQAATRCHRAAGTSAATAAAYATDHRALELRVSLTQLGEDTRAGCEALLAAATGDEQRAMAQVLIAHYWSERYEPAAGLSAAQEGLRLAHACNQPALGLLAAQRLGGVLSRLGRHDDALQTLRPMVPSLPALTLDERLNWLTDFGLTLDYADQRTEALQVLDTVIDEATRHGRWAVAASALSPKSLALMYLGRTAEGLQAMEHSIALCRRAGIEGQGLLVDEATCAGNLRDLGQFSAYLERAERLPQALRDAGSAFWAANAEHDLATAYAWLGRPDLALRTLASPIDGLSPLMQAARLTTRSRLARDFGVGTAGPRPQALLQDALGLLEVAQASGRSHLRLAIALQAARDAAPAAGLATATQIESEGLQRQNAMLAASASCIRLRILLGMGDMQAASSVAMALLDRLGDLGPPGGLYPAELWWLVCQALQQHEPARARAMRAQAVQWVRRTAQGHVPALYREGFLTRNPFNAALLSEAGREGV